MGKVVTCRTINIKGSYDPIEIPQLQFHLPSSPQFENIENIDHIVSSDWTPWRKNITRYSSGEFTIGQIFNSKENLQYVVKM